MSPPFTLDTAFDEALALNRAAFDVGEFEVAYHFLMAGLEAAERAGNTARLDEIERLCRAQLAEVDARSPDHRLATRTAQTRGHRSVYEMGAMTAHAAARRIESERRTAARRPTAPTAPPRPAGQ